MTAIWRPTLLRIDPHTVPDVGFDRMRVTSPYGNRPNPIDNGATTVFHDGLDIGNAREGDDVVADADGKVIVAGTPGWPWSQPTNLYPSGNYGGFMVVLSHGAWCSVYAHLRPDLHVKVGDDVALGQHLADVGSTGIASVRGAHLHYGHIMATAQEIATLGASKKPTRDPWIVIDPVGAMPVAEPTWLEKVEAQALALRKAKPRAYRRWLSRTDLTYRDDGQVLRRLTRLRAEVAMLIEAPEEG